MLRRTIPLVLALCACGDDEIIFEIPALDTDFAIYGTAPAGRALSASAVWIVPTSELGVLKPEVIAGSDVDMFFAGLSPDDLPAGLSPDELVVIPKSEANARPLPTLHDPHVMDVPSPGHAPTPLEPVSGSNVTRPRAAEREARLFTLVSDLAIRSPCTELSVPLTVTTPRIPADLVSMMHSTRDGTTLIGFSTTSTIVVAFAPPGTNDLDIRPVPTGTVSLMQGENATIYGVDGKELQFEGRTWPGALVITYAGTGFGSLGALFVWDPVRRHYVDRTPPTADTYPRVLYGAKNVSIDGQPNLCTFGGAQGADRRAAIWCLAEGATEWDVADFGTSFGVTQLIERPGAELIATDLAGSVWRRDAVRGWRTIFESSINVSCDPLCASFLARWGGPRADLLAIIGGSKAQLLEVRDVGGDVQAFAPTALADALFAEERFGAETPVQFSAIATDASGATWYTTTGPDLFRVRSGDDRFERICLPAEIGDTPITAIHARDDGALFLGMSPALFAYGDWR